MVAPVIDDAQLWLLRHGVAANKSDSNNFEEDYVRPLTPNGERQAVNAGLMLDELTNLDAAYTSPRVRCVQTAMLACQDLGVDVHRDKTLLEMKPRDAIDLVKDGESVLICGHGPELNDTIEHVTGRVVSLPKGGLVGIHIVKGQGTLTHLLGPKDIASLV